MQFEPTHRIAATPARIDARYADVASWREWDEDLKASSIEGPLVSGATGVVEPKSGPKSKERFADVVPERGFAVECGLPLCSMRFEYELRPTGRGTLATHRIVFKGALDATALGRDGYSVLLDEIFMPTHRISTPI